MLLNYTTKISPEQTISEIQKMLSKHNVSAMMTEYDGQEVSGVSFKILVDGQPRAFKLPCNWKSVEQILKENSGKRTIYDTNRRIKIENERRQQAIRTAWRIIKDWIQAQLAMVEVNMVSLPQVFLPYTIVKGGQTLSEHLADNPGFLLGDGSN